VAGPCGCEIGHRRPRSAMLAQAHLEHGDVDVLAEQGKLAAAL